MTIAAEEIEVGTEIVVKPGELVPVDGVVTSGSSSMSEADLTGEPVPVRKMAGMLVLSGSVNLDRSKACWYWKIFHVQNWLNSPRNCAQQGSRKRCC